MPDTKGYRPLVVQLCATRYREVYPLLTNLPSGVLLWGCVCFSVHFCDVLLVLFCDRSDLLYWLMWRSNGSLHNAICFVTRRWLFLKESVFTFTNVQYTYVPARAANLTPMTGIQHRQSVATMMQNLCAKAWSCLSWVERRDSPEDRTARCMRQYAQLMNSSATVFRAMNMAAEYSQPCHTHTHTALVWRTLTPRITVVAPPHTCTNGAPHFTHSLFLCVSCDSYSKILLVP